MDLIRAIFAFFYRILHALLQAVMLTASPAYLAGRSELRLNVDCFVLRRPKLFGDLFLSRLKMPDQLRERDDGLPVKCPNQGQLNLYGISILN